MLPRQRKRGTMTFDLMEQLGLVGFDYSYIFIGLASAIVLLLFLIIFQAIQINKLKKKYKKFMQGKDAKSMETQIIKLFEDTKYLRHCTDDNKKDIK